MKSVGRWLHSGAEGVAGLMLLAMFVTFLLQILSRYVLNAPFGWTLELCLLLWVWLVFWGNAFVVRDSDHVTFDLLYVAAPHRVRRVLSLVAALAIALGLLWSFLPTADWIDFLRRKRSATLPGVRMGYVYSIYLLFLVAVAARYLWRAVHVLRHGPRDRHLVDEPHNQLQFDGHPHAPDEIHDTPRRENGR